LICSLYGHLGSGIVGVGTTVTKGQQIGVIGTYAENGHNPEHLHFGLYPGPYSAFWIYTGYSPPGIMSDSIRPSDFIDAH
jgi:murein DD-endopeptidase MepM/ murein hydrolase activator NlpD